MREKYKGKVILITGASSGIGAAVSRQLAKLGARLVLASRNVKALEKLNSELENPDIHTVVHLDLTSSDSIQSLYQELKNKNIHIDILINNGGISQRSSALETSFEVERLLMETNYFGTVQLSKLIAEDMLERKSGHIVCVSSVVGKFGCPLRSTYSASKHALHGYFDSLRAELSRFGIKVSIVCPGFVNTQVSVNALNEKGEKTGVMDARTEAGLTAEEFAKRFVNGLGRRSEFYIGRQEVLIVYLKRFFPRFYDSLIKRLTVV